MGTLKKFFTHIGTLLTWTEEAFLCLLLLAMILLACVQIFLRTFYSSGILWADPLLRYMVVWAGLFGAAVATKQSKHISIDIISHLVPEQFLPWLRVLLNFFSAGICILLTYAAVKFVRDEALYGGRSILDIPSWELNLVYPLAFALIAGRFLILALKDLGDIVLRKSTIGQT
ncbi:MAG: TRAP transporter small permease subunit [Desulfobulbaceae bacterium]|jgi:TRAP-type C4-dicarboxylate transport system permease small subunit|nr:TRAP transporter small permease subunit [Desulfobulbaceae bacterium]HKJ14383.1 TRAP transporter small permease [Desulfobulbales bacterium]MDH3541808.1 TRAP transporter small permease subunit [Desulfobulbaceae bacterium]MDH3776465.1 TRAP transporter small permease subunit [Desulfobulbaceae bacterium]MDH3781190.1 TRAP transporter small permease subunit [Desulfobulbaceae bacterium]